jgi:hypothetical protein
MKYLKKSEANKKLENNKRFTFRHVFVYFGVNEDNNQLGKNG